MRTILLALTLSVLMLLAAGCGRDDLAAPPAAAPPVPDAGLALDPAHVAAAVVAAAGWEADPDAALPTAADPAAGKTLTCPVFNPVREDLGGGLAHYAFEFAVGDGPYEMVRLHRVVRETAPGRPIRTLRTLFALHGSPGSFAMMFLYGAAAPNVPDDQALAIHLAAQDVDVWGIDRSCNFVPADETDFAFMAGWGLQYNVDALRSAMAVARFARQVTGNGPAPLNLLGFSSGAAIGWAAVNEEAVLPPSQRQVGGFVPVDNNYLTLEGPARDRACATWELGSQQLADGAFAANTGALFNTLGWLARTDPDGGSPIVPGFTNSQTAVLLAATTWQFFVPPGYPPTHFFAGVFDPVSGLPTGLAYTEYEHYLDFLLLPAAWEEQALSVDGAAVGCGAPDTPFDDNLHRVQVPIFYVGAAGGIAPTDPATLGSVGSGDVTALTVQLLPPEAALLDMGHVDLFTSDEAVGAFWQPLAAWIAARADGHGRGVGRPHMAASD